MLVAFSRFLAGLAGLAFLAIGRKALSRFKQLVA